MKTKELIIEIIVISLLLVISIPIFKNNSIKLTLAANNMNSVGSVILTEKHNSNDLFFPMTDEFAINNGDKTILNIKNNSLVAKKYSLLLRVEKISTLNIQYFNYSINDNVYSFNDKTFAEDEYYDYYKLYTDNIYENETIDVKFYMWLKTTTGSEAMNKKLVYSFIVNEDTELVIK